MREGDYIISFCVVKQQQQREQRERFLVNKPFVRLKRHKHTCVMKKKSRAVVFPQREEKSLSLFAIDFGASFCAFCAHTERVSRHQPRNTSLSF